MLQIPLFLVAKRFAIRDEKLKIAGVRLVNTRIIDFIDDAVADGEPEPATGMIGSADAFLRAGGPAWLNSRRTKCN